MLNSSSLRLSRAAGDVKDITDRSTSAVGSNPTKRQKIENEKGARMILVNVSTRLPDISTDHEDEDEDGSSDDEEFEKEEDQGLSWRGRSGWRVYKH